MRRLSVYVGALVAVLTVPVCAVWARPVVQHEMTVRLEPVEHRLTVTDVMTLMHVDEPRLEVDLAPRITIESVMLDGKRTPFAFNSGRMVVPLPAAANHTLRMEYSGRFDDQVPAEPLNTDNPGFGVAGVISARGVMLLAGAGWYPDVHGAASEYRLAVEAPVGMLAVTAGKLLGHSTEKNRTWSRWEVKHPLRGLPLVAGPYQVSTRRFGSVVAATYFTQPLQDLSDSYLRASERYLKLYGDLFGPYPFSQFSVVENFFPTGYGFASFTLMGRRVLQLPFIIHTSLGHEIAHCWWGNGVLVDASQGNWSEGLTTYVADYLYKERRGEGRDLRLQWLRNYAGLVDPREDFAVSGFSSRTSPLTKVVGYDKTAMIFHMLRKKVGDDVFWETLRSLFARYRYKAIAWSHFQAAFEKRAGIDLEPFFRQWVFTAGAPRLALQDVSVSPSTEGFMVSGALVQQRPYYDVNVNVALSTGREKIWRLVAVSGPRTPFNFTVAQRPVQLTADPDVDLFRRLAPQEVPPTVNSLKGADTVLVIVTQDPAPVWRPIAERLSAALGLDNVRIGRRHDFSEAELKRADLLFVGPPDVTGWKPGGGRFFQLTADGFVLDSRSYTAAPSTFFGVFVHPLDERRSAAVFLPSTPAAAKVVSTKIPHYGKYSYLVFNETRNEVKGIWAVERSPMVVRWP